MSVSSQQVTTAKSTLNKLKQATEKKKFTLVTDLSHNTRFLSPLEDSSLWGSSSGTLADFS